MNIRTLVITDLSKIGNTAELFSLCTRAFSKAVLVEAGGKQSIVS